jgi:hypothetical protein
VPAGRTRRAAASPRLALAVWVAAGATAAAAAGAGAVLFAAARRPARPPAPVRPATAAGDAACLSCHADKAPYEATAHRLTSRPPTRAAIAGGFGAGDDVLRTGDPGTYYRMHAGAGGFYQTAVWTTPGAGHGADTSRRTERFAYVLGSGRKGQSYLYWTGDRLYQLPVSYWTGLGGWVMSPGPGYGDGPPNFDRAIAPRCLECHATWMESVPEPDAVNRYRADGALLGITCERCHGAGREHVARERSALHAFRAPGIANPARLDRTARVEACAQCHGGLRAPVAPAFTYVPGQRLDAHLAPGAAADDGSVDVHGNQVALLARSRCYQASQMTCETCHDVHRPQRDPAELSGRCLTCHEPQRCGLFPARGRAALVGRCVDCHMPAQPSRVVVAAFGAGAERVRVRTHWIRAYPAAAAR